jgi:hypothetical protein
VSQRDAEPRTWSNIIPSIHASGRWLVIAATGGGSSAIARLLETPGASRSILEATIPYSLASLTDFLGFRPEQACSAETARAMAMAAFVRARRLAPEEESESLCGIGCTASLATDRPKRGSRRVHVAIQTARYTETYGHLLVNEDGDRSLDETYASSFLLSRIAAACGVDSTEIRDWLPSAKNGENDFDVDAERAQAELSQLLLGDRQLVVVRPHSALEHYVPPAADMGLVFPGSFNPPHSGHLRMANVAEQKTGRPLLWELSITNVDKPPLDFISMRTRIHAIRFEDHDRPIALTRAPTFAEKAKLFPGSIFVVGADTIARVGQLCYYADDPARRAAAIAEIASQGCRFLVFGRQVEGKFQTLADLHLPPELLALCDEVPASDFREDVSSTELRGAAGV